MDYAALTRDNLGRRVNLVEPDESLLLLKATGQIAHDGGMRFGKDSLAYNVFREWIEQRREVDPRQRRRSRSSTVTPPDFAFARRRQAGPGEGDGHVRRRHEGRHHAVLRLPINDDAVADVSPLGAAHAAAAGRRRA